MRDAYLNWRAGKLTALHLRGDRYPDFDRFRLKFSILFFFCAKIEGIYLDNIP